MSQEGPLALVEVFNRAWNAHDLAGAIDLVTDDVVFEGTGPAPDGIRSEGRDAVREAWRPVFENPDSRFDGEDAFAAGDVVVQRWRYSWGTGHVRGVDVIRVRDGKIAEKLSYVKG
jgi:ketosteroid isomerase-like protein